MTGSSSGSWGEHFGTRYKNWRLEKGVSNYYVEQHTGYSRGNLSNIEEGRLQPSDELLNKLASIDKLGLSIERLRAWKRLNGVSSDEKEAILRELLAETDFLPLLQKVLTEKGLISTLTEAWALAKKQEPEKFSSL